MKKIFLTIIGVLILVLCSVLIYHVVTDAPVDIDQTGDGEDYTLADISIEIDDILLNENDEVIIGEMI